MGEKNRKKDVLQGTLALMVLKTLDVLGPMHGYGIARRIDGDPRGRVSPAAAEIETRQHIPPPVCFDHTNLRLAPTLLNRRDHKEVSRAVHGEQVNRAARTDGHVPRLKLIRCGV